MRSGHTVTLIPDGRMLLFGGWDGYKPLSDAYLYQPQFGTWTQVIIPHLEPLSHTPLTLNPEPQTLNPKP